MNLLLMGGGYTSDYIREINHLICKGVLLSARKGRITFALKDSAERI